MSEEVDFIKTLLSQHTMMHRHPLHGHAFKPSSLNFPTSCSVCNETVLIFGNPCKCLICGILAHRACISRTYFNNNLKICSNFQPIKIKKEKKRTSLKMSQKTNSINDSINDEMDEDDGNFIDDDDDISSNNSNNISNNISNHGSIKEIPNNDINEQVNTDEEDEEECISISDPEYRKKQVQRNASLGGSTIIGSVLGSVIGGVGIIASPPLLGVFCGTLLGKAALAFTGATYGYRRQRLKQLEIDIDIPTEEKIPKFWKIRAELIRNNSAMKFIHTSFSSIDFDIQNQVNDCNIEEKINIFVSKVLFNKNTLPGYLYVKLIDDYKSRHEVDYNADNEIDKKDGEENENNDENDNDDDDRVKDDIKDNKDERDPLRDPLNSMLEYESDGSEGNSSPTVRDPLRDPLIPFDDKPVELTFPISTIDMTIETNDVRSSAMAAEEQEDANNDDEKDDENNDDAKEEDEDENEIASPVMDAIGLQLEMVKVIFHYHPLLGHDDKTVQLTINTVERIIFGDIYDYVFKYLIFLHDKEDSQLYQTQHSDKTSSDDKTHTSVSSLIRQSASWENLFITEEGIRALTFISKSKTGFDKLRCINKFVNCVSNDAFQHLKMMKKKQKHIEKRDLGTSGGDVSGDVSGGVSGSDVSGGGGDVSGGSDSGGGVSGGGGDVSGGSGGISADDLLPLLAKHVAVAQVPCIHAELAFVTLFCRDEALLIGADGYALTSLCAAVGALDTISAKERASLQAASVEE